MYSNSSPLRFRLNISKNSVSLIDLNFSEYKEIASHIPKAANSKLTVHIEELRYELKKHWILICLKKGMSHKRMQASKKYSKK